MNDYVRQVADVLKAAEADGHVIDGIVKDAVVVAKRERMEAAAKELYAK